MSITYKEKGKYRHYETFCNEDVIEYLSYRFNTITSWFSVVCKCVLNNAVLTKFGDVYFIINASKTCIELTFAKTDAEKMNPVIEELKRWEKFSKSYKPFCVKVDKDSSRSLLLESGFQKRSDFRAHFSKYKLEFSEI